MNHIIKKITATVILIMHILIICPQAFGETALDATGLNTIEAPSYSGSSGAAADSADNSRITVSAGGYVTYSVNVLKSGFYKLLIYGKYVSSKPTITVSGVGETVYKGIGITSNTDRRHTIGRFYLSEGKNDITLTFSSAVNIKELFLKNVEHEVEDRIVIEAHDYLTSNISSNGYEDLQWNYTTTNTDVSVSGPVIAGTKESVRRSVTYKLNVVTEGLYRMKVWASGSDEADYTIESDGVEISKAKFVPLSSFSVTKCESADFETFNLSAGEQKITIRTLVTSDYIYTYYFTLERVGDVVSKADILKDSENLIEGEDLFYLDTGIEESDGAMSISNTIARADVAVEESGIYAVTVKYKADDDTDVWIRWGVSDEVCTTLAKTEGTFAEVIYQIKNFDASMIRMLFWSEYDILIDSVKFSFVPENAASDFVFAVNNASNIQELEFAFESFKSETGADFKNASDTVLYKYPLYERILNGNYETVQDFSESFMYALKNESLNKRVTAKNGTKSILQIESGNISVSVDTFYYNESKAYMVGAIFEESGNAKKLYMLDAKNYKGQSKITFDFKNVVKDENKKYTFDIVHFDDFDKMLPKDMFPDDYVEIFVSKSGDDATGDGTENRPLKTIEKAIEYANMYSAYQWGDIVINIDSGTYTLSDTLRFDETTSGKNGFKIKFVGNSQNPPVISGGKEVSEWESVGNGIYSASLSGVEYVRNLYVDGYPAVRARSEGRFEAGELYKQEGSTWSKDGFKVLKEFMPYSFKRPEDLEIVWTYGSGVPWESRRTPVENVLEGENDYTFLVKREIFNYTSDRCRRGSVFYLENALEFLDTPGEFYYDKAEEKIYYMPYEGEDLDSVITYVGNLEQMVEIKGSSLNKKAENIIFENLVFRYGTYNFASKYGYNGEQADSFQTKFRGDDGSEGYRAQIYAENAKGIEIKNCEISCMGSSGIHFKEGVSDSLIEGNMIRDLSGTGVTIGHPDHEDKVAGVAVCDGISVKNNVFRRNAAEYFNNTQISVYYEKNIDILHNDIDFAPYSGMTIGWGWEGSNPYNCGNIDVSYNSITNVMQILNDGGAIYTLGKLKGSTISNNYLNGSGGTVAGTMYQDTGSSYMEIYNNVILNAKKSIYASTLLSHDLNYYNNYSNIKEVAPSVEEDRVYVETPIEVDENNLTGEALEIKESAGVEEEYKWMLASDEFGERRNRIAFPSYADPELIIANAEDYITSKSSAGISVEEVFGGKSVTVGAGKYITFPIDIKESGYYKVLLEGSAVSSTVPTVTVEDHTGTKGYGVRRTTEKRYTLGRYEFAEGEKEIKLSVSKNGVNIKKIVLKKVMHEVFADRLNLVEVHDYYTANINSVDQEDWQWSYESAKCDTAVCGPVIALSNQTRNLTYKMNVKEAGTYKMNIYYAGAPSVKFSVLADDVLIAEKTATGTKKSDPCDCVKMTIDGITLPEGDITFGLTFAPQESGIIYTYYFELEKVEQE